VPCPHAIPAWMVLRFINFGPANAVCEKLLAGGRPPIVGKQKFEW
jgi:hypothetical protein